MKMRSALLTVVPDQDVICFGVSDPVAEGAFAQLDGVRQSLGFLDICLIHLVGRWQYISAASSALHFFCRRIANTYCICLMDKRVVALRNTAYPI
jgi:hypothetical protein